MVVKPDRFVAGIVEMESYARRERRRDVLLLNGDEELERRVNGRSLAWQSERRKQQQSFDQTSSRGSISSHFHSGNAAPCDGYWENRLPAGISHP